MMKRQQSMLSFLSVDNKRTRSQAGKNAIRTKLSLLCKLLSFKSEEKIVDFLKSSACVAELTVAAKQSSFVNFFVVRCLKYVPVNCLTGCSKIIAFKNANV